MNKIVIKNIVSIAILVIVAIISIFVIAPMANQMNFIEIRLKV